MKLKLCNFLCYENLEIDLGESGLSLLSGKSGSGKTSLLRAILFVILGEGSKLQMYGKTSCSVEMNFEDLKIIRTKRPNRLIVNDIYEDATGQEIINKKFGSTFKTSGYIQQNNLNSFIYMSPVEKIEFLEKFAFRETDITSIKNRTKSYINQKNEQLISVNAQLSTAKTLVGELKVPEKIECPLKYKKKSSIPKLIKNENTKFANLQTLCNRELKKHKKLEKEITHLQILKASIDSKLQTSSELKSKIETVKNKIKNSNFIGEEKLQELLQELELCIKHKEVIELKKQKKQKEIQLEEMKAEEIMSLEKEIENISSSLWKEYSKEEVTNMISELKECLNDLNKIKQLKEGLSMEEISPESIESKYLKLENFKENLIQQEKQYKKYMIQQELYVCPCCDTNLRLVENKLQISNTQKEELLQTINLEETEKEIEQLKTNITKLTKIITIDESKSLRDKEIQEQIEKIASSYQEELNNIEVSLDLEYLMEYKQTQEILEKKFKEINNKLTNEIFSSSFKAFVIQLSKLEEDISELHLEVKNLPQKEETYLRDIIQEQTISKQRFTDYNLDLKEMKISLENINSSVDKIKDQHISVYHKIQDVNTLTLNLEEHQRNINKFHW